MKTALWWLRRDLRLHDNQALAHALSRSDRVIPVFILDPTLLSLDAPRRKDFLYNTLRNLSADLEKRGSRLILRRGDPLEELTILARETDADLVCAEADYSLYARQRDSKVSANLNATFTGGLTIHPPGAVTKDDGGPYVVYTWYSRTWNSLPAPGRPLDAPTKLPAVPDIPSDFIPPADESKDFPATEAEAHKRLDQFLAGLIFSYKKDRNRMDLSGTSHLSPYFRFGLLSARTAAFHVRELIQNTSTKSYKENCSIWLDELIWREFYINILDLFPHVLEKSFREDMRDIHWRSASHDLEAWESGLTGFPAVDAGMRQLANIGWIHNRARMIVASFLVKDLLISWQEGEAWFMRQLIDGDPAANNGGWQWTAGTGTDAAPYFRIFNPILQGKKFDPEGKYIRMWLPELARVPDKYIHTPWDMPEELQEKISMRIGRDYPERIVDHSIARKRTLDAYKQAKKS